jgi:hypothetical protein
MFASRVEETAPAPIFLAGKALVNQKSAGAVLSFLREGDS